MGTLGCGQCAFCPRLIQTHHPGGFYFSKVNWHPLCRECMFNPNARAPFPSAMEKARQRMDQLSKNPNDDFNKLPNSTKMAIAEYQHSNKELGTVWRKSVSQRRLEWYEAHPWYGTRCVSIDGITTFERWTRNGRVRVPCLTVD